MSSATSNKNLNRQILPLSGQVEFFPGQVDRLINFQPKKWTKLTCLSICLGKKLNLSSHQNLNRQILSVNLLKKHYFLTAFGTCSPGKVEFFPDRSIDRLISNPTNGES
jgi:hypothetical protein